MNDDFAPFELAIKLKEKGYPQHITDKAYITDNYGEDEYDIGDRLPIPLIPDYMDDVAAPTINQVLKWLRNEKKIYCLPYFEQGIDMWLYAICKPAYGCEFPEFISESIYDSYEQAAVAGVNYCLENLI